MVQQAETAEKPHDPVVAAAVEATLKQKRAQEEEAKLEKEIEDLEASMDVDALPDLADTGLQRVKALLEEFVSWDTQRQVNKVKTEIAKEAGDVEGAKQLISAKPRILKHLNVILKKLVDVLAEEEDVREEMVNWLAMPSNLRDLLAKHLRERKNLNVSPLVQRARDIETERRTLRRLTQQQG